MDIGSFNKSEAQISSCSRFVLHNSSNKIFILIYKKKQPGDKGDQISSPFVYQAQESRFWFPCQGSDRIFDFFPSFPDFSPEKSHESLIFMKNLDLFHWVKSWALDFSSNLNGNTNVCNNTEKWRSMQLTNTIEQYTNFNQSSERKLLQWRTRTTLIRQFKYCFSNF